MNDLTLVNVLRDFLDIAVIIVETDDGIGRLAHVLADGELLVQYEDDRESFVQTQDISGYEVS